MKKGKMLVGILIGIVVTVFVQKNKWCQEQLAKAKEKGEEILNKCKHQTEEDPAQPTEEK